MGSGHLAGSVGDLRGITICERRSAKSTLLDLQNLLQDTTATLEKMEREVARAPQDWGLTVTAQSLRRRQAQLEEEFAALANSNWQDVCRTSCAPGARGHAGNHRDPRQVPRLLRPGDGERDDL
jgi:hypothetical protein